MATIVFGALKGAFGAFKAYKAKVAEFGALADDAEELFERITNLELSVMKCLDNDALKDYEDNLVAPLQSTVTKMKQINAYVEIVRKFSTQQKDQGNLKTVLKCLGEGMKGNIPDALQPLADSVLGEIGGTPAKEFEKLASQLDARVQSLTLYVLLFKDVPKGKTPPKIDAGKNQELVSKMSAILKEDMKESGGDVKAYLVRINDYKKIACWAVQIGDKAYFILVRSHPEDKSIYSVVWFMLPGIGDMMSVDLAYIGSGWTLSYDQGITTYLDKQKTIDGDYYQECRKFLKLPVLLGDPGQCASPPDGPGQLYNPKYKKLCGCCGYEEEFECVLPTQSGTVKFSAQRERMSIAVNGTTFYA